MNPKMNKETVHIGKNGQLRFKKSFVDQFKIEEGQRFSIGYDASEPKEQITALYLVRDDKNGIKVNYSNSSFHMCAVGIAKEFNIDTPAMLFYEPYKDEETEAIKIIINRNPLANNR